MDRDEALDEFIMAMIASATNSDRKLLAPSMLVSEAGIDSLNLMAIIAQVDAQYGFGFTALQIEQMFAAEKIADVISLMRRAASTAPGAR
jgi:acyl carrier protein